jgi:hypothetical protein
MLLGFLARILVLTEMISLLRSVLCSAMADFLVGTGVYVGGVP